VDYSIFSDNLNLTRQKAGPKLFLLSSEDVKDLDTLKAMYPNGASSVFPGQYGKKFNVFIVPQFALR
jgi:hypothetical protein